MIHICVDGLGYMNSISILCEAKQNLPIALKGSYMNCQFHSILVVCNLNDNEFVKSANYTVFKVILNLY